MEISIFAKKRQTKEGKTFYTYLTTLTNRDGVSVSAQVKFRESCAQPKPESCPRNIVFDKRDGNLSVREFTNEKGETVVSRTLWISAWDEGSPYEDHSLDDYM